MSAALDVTMIVDDYTANATQVGLWIPVAAYQAYLGTQLQISNPNSSYTLHFEGEALCHCTSRHRS